MSILIIDDDPSSRLLLSAILETWEYNTVEANDCYEGWQLLNDTKNKFFLAFVDWNTPRMTGIELIQQIRQDERFKDLTIIMTTGNHDPESIQKAIHSGVNEYLMKPFVEDMVLEKIRMTGIHLSKQH